MNFDPQILLVIGVVTVAIVAAGVGIYRRARSFRAKSDCGVNCGCGTEKGAKIR